MDKQSQRMERLIQIGRELSSAADLYSVSLSILDAAMALTGSEAASMLKFDEESNSLHFLGCLPEIRTIKMITVPMDASIAGLAFHQKKTIPVNDAANSQLHFKDIDQVTGYKTRSVLACPILFRGEALGVIEAVNKIGPADYNGDDATILETLAAHAALFLKNAQLQSLLEKTRNEAIRLDKMKNDFVAITSHELRTPLGLILGHSTFLRELVDSEYHAQLDTIINNAMRLKEIIESMSVVDNAQSGMAMVRSQRVSVRQLVLDTVKNLSAEAEKKNIYLIAHVNESEMQMEADAGKIGTAITNIIENAITYTNEGGYVLIATEQVPGYFKVTVSDDGVGIPAKDCAHVFERFYQVESHLTRKHGGMGLGLSVAKMNVEIHGGRILLESVEGKGSIFTVLLPVDPSQAAAAGDVFSG